MQAPCSATTDDLIGLILARFVASAPQPGMGAPPEPRAFAVSVARHGTLWRSYPEFDTTDRSRFQLKLSRTKIVLEAAYELVQCACDC
jgi:hypothetical protein